MWAACSLKSCHLTGPLYVPSLCLENALIVELSQATSLPSLSVLGALPVSLTVSIVVSFNPLCKIWAPHWPKCFSSTHISGTKQTHVCQLSELVHLGLGFTVATLRAWSPGLPEVLTQPTSTTHCKGAAGTQDTGVQPGSSPHSPPCVLHGLHNHV